MSGRSAVSMRRRHRGEQIEPARRRTLKAQKLARRAKDNLETLRDARATVPDELDDRAADGWELLLGIADLCGGEWPARARAAAVVLSGGRDDVDYSLSIKLLIDIKTIFESHSGERIGSTELCCKLTALETSPWATVSRGKPLTPARLARMLKGFDIFVTKSATHNEYRIADFEDAFSRYLPTPPDQSSIGPQTLGAVRATELSEAPTDGTSKSAENPSESDTSGTMELSNKGMGAKHENSSVTDGGEMEVEVDVDDCADSAQATPKPGN